MEQPCRKDCPERSADCHAVCEKYREFERARNAEYDKRKAQIETESAMYDSIDRIRMRNYRRNREWRRS